MGSVFDCAFFWAPVKASQARRNPLKCDKIIIHRIEVSQEDATFGDSPAEVTRFFAHHPIGIKATGGAMPYPLLIDAHGLLTQTLPLSVVAPHARSFNESAIGVGCIGDFRSKEPAALQYATLVRVAAHLLTLCHLGVDAICGHDELSGGSADPNKICPGQGLPIASLRRAVQAALAGPTALDLVW